MASAGLSPDQSPTVSRNPAGADSGVARYSLEAAVVSD
jgi:hypothetical protein